MSERILVVDDDTQITSFLKTYLEKQGFTAFCAASGKEMRSLLASETIDLCILDIGLPDADGFELTREIRTNSNLPIIVLSVRTDAFDRIFGLEFGADDYITKPFEPRELVARIRSVLRRTRADGAGAGIAEADRDRVQFGPWIMNLAERTLIHAETGKDPGLTSMEFDLLRVLVEHPRVVLSRDQLIGLSRGYTTVVGDRAIDVHIMRLRKKIEADNDVPLYVKTVHGVGYCFAHDVTRVMKPA